MLDFDEVKYVTPKNVLLAIYAAALGFFLGMLFGALIPFSSPYDAFVGYLLGFLASGFISFELIKKWKAPASTKLVASLILLVIIATISVRLQLMGLELTKIHLTLMSR